MKTPQRLLPAAATLMVAACATTPTPPAEPVLTLGDKVCATSVGLAAPVAMTPAKGKPAMHVFGHPVTAATPCLSLDGKSGNHVVFALPARPDNHTITIGGLQEPLRTLAPRVAILDGAGAVIRTFEADRFSNVGSSHAVQFRPAPEARFVLVTTDPDLVGKVVTGFEQSLTVGSGYVATPTGGGAYTTYGGRESATRRVYSHEGVVQVVVQAVTGKIGQPEAK
jgi:hypothetical protein